MGRPLSVCLIEKNKEYGPPWLSHDGRPNLENSTWQPKAGFVFVFVFAAPPSSVRGMGETYNPKVVCGGAPTILRLEHGAMLAVQFFT